ncbi:MAG: DUF1003 domain-containing protein [Bryobacterales bacterium]
MDKHELIERMHKLGTAEGRAVASFLRHETVAGNVNQEFHEQLTFGQKMADRVAAIGGSWAFVLSFLVIITGWMYFNVQGRERFDPYPFILLNLVLSCLAALQAPIIMMSQNRQAAKDRLTTQNDYEVNLKAEIEIAAMSAKIDQLMDPHWRELLDLQMRQVELLERIEARGSK